MTTVATFSIAYTQLLDEKGQLQGELPAFAKDKATVIHLYRNMVLTRLFDKKAIALQRTGKMGTYAPINGQEAIGTAIGHALKPEDILVPYYRDYAAQFQRGVKPAEILTYWGGDERGNQYECGGQDLAMSVPIASQCLHASGVAFALKYREQKSVALVTLGDGGTSEGDFYEAINAAGIFHLPLVFVINNNQWAISVPLENQTATQTLAQKAIAAGFAGEQVDGNDILACRQIIGEAIEKARRGEGPTLIEALSYRLSDHTTADDATRYQPQDEVKAALPKEPLHRMQLFLTQTQQWDDAQDKALHEDCEREIEAAVDSYLHRQPQNIASIFDYHYATLPDYLVEQRATAIEEEAHSA